MQAFPSTQSLEEGMAIMDQPAGKRTSVVLEEDQTLSLRAGSIHETNRWGRLNAYLEKFQVESRGIEKVPQNEQTDRSLTNAATMWLSSNMTVSAFALGTLSTPIFALEFIDSSLVILFINTLGILPVAFYSTMGPRFGLRQMVLGRYWFGFHPVKAFAALNALAAICWSAVNSIVGAQLFHFVNPNMPGWAGIIVIAAGCGTITMFGYKIVHQYQKWSWIPSFVVFLIVLGEFAHSGVFSNAKIRPGSSSAGSVISFAAAVFGNSTGWSTYAADYTVYMSPKTSRKKIFAWTFVGLFVPLVFTQILGAAIATTIVSNADFASAYDNAGAGGLLGQVLVFPLGNFGHFCLVVLALGIIANNCPNQYSISLNLQVLSVKTQMIPRYLWTSVSVVAFAALAVAGYGHFESFLENFMLIIAYWVSIYESISLIEHFAFRKGMDGYNPEGWSERQMLPPGIAASVAASFGVIGAVLGMAQVWFVGPIGSLIGNPHYGGDVGFELAFAFSAVVYIPCRYLEKKYFRR